MDKDRFSTLLKDPSKVTDADIKALNEYRKKYPYFQSLYVVVAKALKDRNHPKTEAFIKKAAIFSANRSYLKEIIEGDYSFVEKKKDESVQHKPKPEPLHEKTKKVEPVREKKDQPAVETPQSEDKKVEVFSSDKKKTETQTEVGKPKSETTSNTKAEIITEEKASKIEEKKLASKKAEETKEDKSVEEKYTTEGKRILPQAQEIARDLKEIEAAKRRIEALLAGTPIEDVVEKPEVKPKGKKKNQIEIIEKFIQNEPQLDRIKLADSESSTGLEDLASKSLKDYEVFETETLAQLMIKQGKLKRAKDIYEKLSLKFPEKSTYFASQIQKIKSE